MGLFGPNKGKTQPTLVDTLKRAGEAADAERRAREAAPALAAQSSSRPFAPASEAAKAALMKKLSPQAVPLGALSMSPDFDRSCAPVRKVVELAVPEGVCDPQWVHGKSVKKGRRRPDARAYRDDLFRKSQPPLSALLRSLWEASHMARWTDLFLAWSSARAKCTTGVGRVSKPPYWKAN